MAFEPSKIVANIVGRVVAPAEQKFDGALTELRVAVGHRRKDQQTGEYVDDGTTWVTYKANGEYGKPLQAFGKGDLVKIVDGDIRTREFERKAGGTGLQVDVRFGTIELLEAKGEREAAGDTW